MRKMRENFKIIVMKISGGSWRQFMKTRENFETVKRHRIRGT